MCSLCFSKCSQNQCRLHPTVLIIFWKKNRNSFMFTPNINYILCGLILIQSQCKSCAGESGWCQGVVGRRAAWSSREQERSGGERCGQNRRVARIKLPNSEPVSFFILGLKSWIYIHTHFSTSLQRQAAVINAIINSVS